MKSLRTIFILLAFFPALTQAQQPVYSTVKITPPATVAERNELLGLLEIDHYYYDADGSIVSEISAGALARLRQSGRPHRVVIEDVARHLNERNRIYEERKARGEKPEAGRLAFEQTGKTLFDIIPTPSSFEVKDGFGGYYSFDEMNQAMNNLVSLYPGLVQKTSIGKTVNNRDIWCIKISDNVASDEDEPEVLFMGLQHAREAIGGSSMLFFMQFLCENYSTDSRVRDLVNNREIYIVPCVNPDGWEYNRSSGAGSGWRKNRKSNSGGSYGVDLNRNYGVDWGNCAGASSSCGSSSQSAETYYGTAAFSEKETQAIRDLTYSRRFVAMIDQHAYGPYYSLPFGRPSLHTMDPLDARFYTYVPAAMGFYNGMRAGNSPESVGYEVAGGVKDWMLMGNIGTGTKGKIYGMTGEGGAGGGSTGAYASFWAPKEQIEYLCKGMTFQNLQLLHAAGSYVNLQDTGPMNLTNKTTSFTFNMTRVGLDNKPVTVSVVPIENVASVGTPVSTSLANYFDSYSGSVPVTLPSTLPSGQRVSFAWKIETGGITYYDTVVKFYNAQELVNDNMDGTFSTNWTGSGGWGFTTTNGTGYGGGTSKALSESPSGNYTSSSTRICTYKNSINLSGSTAAYINFWVRHRSENFRDILQVQVSEDGTNWIPIAGTTTVQEPITFDGSRIDGKPSLTGIREDWTRETFDLKDFLNATNLRLRFHFSSDATVSGGFDYQTDDGFYIDNLSLFRTTAPLVTLPVQFTDFTAVLTPARTTDLRWTAVTDAQHSHFEVERSGNGWQFQAIGRVEGQQPFAFTDLQPLEGLNHYRIRQVDRDGSISYSKTLTVLNELGSGLRVQIYPNPAPDQVNLRFTGERPEKLQLQVTDLSGRTLITRSLVSGNNGNEIQLDLRALPAQTYMLRVVNANGEIRARQKFVKQ